MALNRWDPATYPDYDSLSVSGRPYTVPLSSGMRDSANANLKAVAEAQEHEYQQVYRPINRELIASVDSMDLVAAAKDNAARGFGEAGRARTQRQLSRYGLNETNLERQEGDIAAQSASRLNYIDSVNNAYLQQYERNTGLRDEMINVGRGVAASAQSNLAGAAEAETAVRNQNAAISAQNSAARTQMVGSVAGMALMAAIMM